MHVDTSDPTTLVVENRPVFVPAFGLLFLVTGLWHLVQGLSTGEWTPNEGFGIGVFILMGGGLFLYTARREAFRFDTGAGELFWQRRNLFGERCGSLPLEEIEQVSVHCGPEPDSGTYRIILHTTTQGIFPLTPDFTCGEEHHRDVALAIETALRL